MIDELEQYTNPLKKVIPPLFENGYSGYIFSEYEGFRYALLASGHLGTQHTRLKRLLGEARE